MKRWHVVSNIAFFIDKSINQTMQYCILTLRKDSKLEDYFSAVQFSKYSVCVQPSPSHPVPRQWKNPRTPLQYSCAFPGTVSSFFFCCFQRSFPIGGQYFINTCQYGSIYAGNSSYKEGWHAIRIYWHEVCKGTCKHIYSTYMHHKNKNIKLVCQIEFPFTIIIHSLKIGTKMKKNIKIKILKKNILFLLPRYIYILRFSSMIYFLKRNITHFKINYHGICSPFWPRYWWIAWLSSVLLQAVSARNNYLTKDNVFGIP